MAITKTRTIHRVEVYPGGTDPYLSVTYLNTFDDSEDNTLPETTQSMKNIERYTITVADDGTESSAATDVTGEDQLVQDICAAVWTD